MTQNDSSAINAKKKFWGVPQLLHMCFIFIIIIITIIIIIIIIIITATVIIIIIVIIISIIIIIIIIIIITIAIYFLYNITTTWWEKCLDIWELPTLWNVKDPAKDESCS